MKDKYADISQLCILPETTLREAMACIDRGGAMIALVTDDQQRLLDTVTDGDLRRAILAELDLTTPIGQLGARKSCDVPVTAPASAGPGEILQQMARHQVRHMPLVDEEGRVVDLVQRRQLLPSNVTPLEAVVMAGGAGTRLRPLTENVPKPMLPVGHQPLLELTIDRLREAGIQQVSITTHYKPEKIVEHFGDGQEFGIDLNYVSEQEQLGTAGALGLMTIPAGPFLVINGDILTDVDYQAMYDFHLDHQSVLTVGVREYDLNVPYGVVEVDEGRVSKLVEKPLLRFFVNAGIYLLDPAVRHFIPRDQRFDMTDLIQAVLEDGLPVVSFPIHEYWLDIGQLADYQKAQKDVQTGKFGVRTGDQAGG